eukprot:2751818-Pyramimonas_sp.AAC.1
MYITTGGVEPAGERGGGPASLFEGAFVRAEAGPTDVAAQLAPGLQWRQVLLPAELPGPRVGGARGGLRGGARHGHCQLYNDRRRARRRRGGRDAARPLVRDDGP